LALVEMAALAPPVLVTTERQAEHHLLELMSKHMVAAAALVEVPLQDKAAVGAVRGARGKLELLVVATLARVAHRICLLAVHNFLEMELVGVEQMAQPIV
jgi:hypothetical protein